MDKTNQPSNANKANSHRNGAAWRARTIVTMLAVATTLVFTSCDDFIFGNVNINYNDNPLEAKPIPHSGADKYVDSLKKIRTTQPMANPDPNGAFANWATCLAMFKEGHSHGDGMMHGNFVYHNAPWRQEQFVIVHNGTDKWPSVQVQRQSTVTYLEQYAGKQGPDYIRIIGGKLKRWGLCLYFFDKEGKLMNDDILNHSDEYQIFFTVSDVDDKGNPYEVTDCRGTWHPNKNKFGEWKKGGTVDSTPVPSPFFADKTTWKQRADATPKIFEYTYRDTWIHDAMGDGARELFNQRLLPPLTRKDADWAVAPYDQDRVGLKGHFNFDLDADENDKLHSEWPFEITKRTDPATGEAGKYTRPSYLLPKFYLSVRVMKCPKGKKALIPRDEYLKRHSTYEFISKLICADWFNPDEPKEYGADSQWQEVIRFNIPIKVYCSSFDTDPTAIDPNDPFYYYLGLEIGLSPADALEASQNLQTHGVGGGSGFGNWFL